MKTATAGDVFADGKWHEESCELRDPGGVVCDCGLMEAIESVEQAVLDQYLPSDRVGIAVHAAYRGIFIPTSGMAWGGILEDQAVVLSEILRGEREIG